MKRKAYAGINVGVQQELVSAAEELKRQPGKSGPTHQGHCRATHALSCGVPDRESKEARYLQEALDMIEEP